MSLTQTIVLGLLLLIIHIIFSRARGLIRNIGRARGSGIPFIIVPISSYHLFFVLFGTQLLGLLDHYFGPPTLETSWRWLVRGSWPWRRRYAPFADLGDTFLTVSPDGLILYTADADVIDQLLSRTSDFPKPIHLYKNVDIFGKNVVSTEGAAWKRHRRLVAPAFGEKNNRLVWEETIRQTRALVNLWAAVRPSAITTAQKQSMQLSLNVIGRAGFGRDLGLATDDAVAYAEMRPIAHIQAFPNSHVMSFVESLAHLLKNILVIVILPKWFLKRAPSAAIQKAYISYVEFRKYMQEMLNEKKFDIQSIPQISRQSNMDLLRQLMTAHDPEPSTYDNAEPSNEKHSHMSHLSDAEVLGNAFVILFAGHETTAGMIHSLLVMLALHPSC